MRVGVPAGDGVGPPTGTPGGPHPPATPPRHLFRVDRRRLVLSQILTPNTLAVPFLAVFPVYEFLGEDPSFTTVFTAVSAIVGVVQMPVRRVLGEWDFTVGEDADGLRVQRGLLDVRNQTVPRSRIQAVRIRRPLLWRPFGWVRAELDVAGYGAGSSGEVRGGALVPVADADTVHAVVREVLPSLPRGGPEALGLRPAPAAARWRMPLQAGRLAYGATADLLVTRYGWPAVRYDLARYARAQSVRVSQGPWQRALGLASVHLDTAGGQTTPTVLHRAEADALAVADELVARSRAARPGPSARR